MVPLFTSQNNQSNGFYFASKKDHLSHTRHVKINLSKMIGGLFDLIEIWFF
jgi:predicted membrane protein